MLNLSGLPAPVPGLAHALDEPSPPLAQNFPISPLQQDNNSAIAHLEPQQAITLLLDQHDDNIFAYLRFVRSLDQNVHYSPGHGPLSSHQVAAVGALRNCADDEIRTWLEQARKLSSDPEQPKCSRADTLQEPAFAYSSAGQIEGFYQSTLNPSGAYPQQTLDNTNTLREAIKAANRYWCTICDDRHSYKNRSDWMKHEKEHVDTFVCMVAGPLEETRSGSKCTLCGDLNPSEEHFGVHEIQKCGQGVPGSFSCKRRVDFVHHLIECHNVQGKAQGRAIADKWKQTTKKQAWSCGFCSHLDHAFGDRLKHLASHFERGQTLNEWDATKVMEGLLSQPGMANVWKIQLSASLLGWESSKIIWEKHLVKELQHDLEVGPSDTKHAEALANAAYEACKSSGHLLNRDKRLALAPIQGAPGPSAIVPRSGYDLVMEREFERTSNQALSQSVANPAETLHYGVPALDGNQMATSDYVTFPASSEDGGSSSIQAPWLFGSSQTWTPAEEQYNDFDGY